MATNKASQVITGVARQTLCAVIPAKAGIFLALGTLILAACGGETTENVTNISQMGMDVVSSVGDLPKCSADNEGEQAFVKGETSARICVDGKWLSLSAGDNATIECSTKPLADKSGLKIVCNGDSIGVVLNGAKGDKGDAGDPGAAGKDGLDGKDGENGKDGDDGVGCSVANQTDSSVTIKCGTDKFIMSLNGGNGTTIVDTNSSAYEIENASISGVSQKGPFVKGAAVTAFELDGSKSLLQTGRTFIGTISQDDGRFNMNNVTLKSSYVRLSANGYYRNEVTGKRSASPITLNAVTDLDARNTVNVNLLTHLEYDRVAYLMAHGDGTLKLLKAKKQAEKEIFKAFHIDATGFAYSEDLDVFGKTDADAALLAISILLQGERSEAELTELLTSFSTDFSTDSSWDDVAKRAEIANWAQEADVMGQLPSIRKKVQGWGLSDTVPEFEKYVRNYWQQEIGFGTCGSETVPEFTLKSSLINNKYMRMYLCHSGEWVNLSPWSWDVPKEYRMNPNIAYGELTDSRDKQTYRIVQIGNQTWMAENLNYADTVRTPSLKGRMWCYDNEEENCEVAGRLYTWDAAVDGICPEGWHLPDKDDWNELILKVEGLDRGDALLKSLSGWGEPAYGYTNNGTDDYGFSALPVGARYINDTFGNQGKFAYFWSATERDDTHAYHVYLNVDQRSVSLVYKNDNSAYLDNTKESGFSVRCIKDATAAP